MVLDYSYLVNTFYNSQYGSGLTTTSSTTNPTLALRFISTQFLSKYDITNGSVIRITKSGYGYRPEGWIDLDEKNATRPDNVTTETVIVDEAWWGEFMIRAFNIYKTNNSNVTEEDVSALRIYVKI
jgi:hypothetical protein